MRDISQLLINFNQLLLSNVLPSNFRSILVSVRDELSLLDFLPEKNRYAEERTEELIEIINELIPLFINLSVNFNIDLEDLLATLKKLT